ncbi:hypothetical protein [Streptomyces sp. NRRL S-1448]|uniref:hypothetical protein n=1 Tax=Streptomyces sp. NRRL S-1448 TaxID=1463883 RepID=UPI0004BFD02E|nr:hypothetical protein [Streptomyces sp. NRRL S-1448]
MDLDVLNDKPWERSACEALLRHWSDQGCRVLFLGNPDHKEHRDRYTPVTTDYHLEVDGISWFIDHTVLPMPLTEGKQGLGAARDGATRALLPQLTQLVAEHPGLGLRVSVVPQAGRDRNQAKAYYRMVLELSRESLSSGRALNDPLRPLSEPFDIPTVTPFPLRDSAPSEAVMLLFDLKGYVEISYSLRPDGTWGHDATTLIDSIGHALRKKFTKQLANATATGCPVGLVLDSRPEAGPRLAPLALPAPDVSAVVHTLAEEHPEILNRAWYLEPGGQLTVIYNRDSNPRAT